jgi:tRNA nucleotidyltransferase/poly(A) polymerase
MKILFDHTSDLMSVGRRVASVIQSLGYEAYIVGGAARDLMMGIENIHDIDISTNMPISVIKQNWKTVEYGGGEKHGTVIIVEGDDTFELTQFRSDGDYSDGRHPDSVIFVDSFYKDTCRRDFTINAMGINSDGEVIDYHNGIDDLNKKWIRCVGCADDRFTEDALRMIRAIRFAAKFGFTMSDDVYASICKNKKLISLVSKERILDEIKKTISCGKNVFCIFLQHLYETGLWDVICPGIKLNANVFDTLIQVNSPNLVVSLSIIMHMNGNDDKLITLRDLLMLDNDTMAGVKYVVLNLTKQFYPTALEKYELYTHKNFNDFVLVSKSMYWERLIFIELSVRGNELINLFENIAPNISSLLFDRNIKSGREFGMIRRNALELLYFNNKLTLEEALDRAILTVNEKV